MCTGGEVYGKHTHTRCASNPSPWKRKKGDLIILIFFNIILKHFGLRYIVFSKHHEHLWKKNRIVLIYVLMYTLECNLRKFTFKMNIFLKLRDLIVFFALNDNQSYILYKSKDDKTRLENLKILSFKKT